MTPTLEKDAGMDASDANTERIIQELRKFPNPNAIWSAFEAGIIDEQTARRLLPKEERPRLARRILDAVFDILVPTTKRYM